MFVGGGREVAAVTKEPGVETCKRIRRNCARPAAVGLQGAWTGTGSFALGRSAFGSIWAEHLRHGGRAVVRRWAHQWAWEPP